MTQTVSSATTTYCTAAEAVQRLDTRILGQWLADDGTQMTPALVLASTVFAALLKGASGEFESAILVGERYTPDDIVALTVGATNSGELVKDIIAGLVLARVWGRRPRLPSEGMPPMVQWAQQQLEALRLGVRIFGFDETEAAGLLDHKLMSTDEVRRRPLLSNKVRKFFGRRSIADDDTDFRE